MFLWMKRGFVISSALLTIGFFSPTDMIRDVQASEPQKTYDVNNENPFIYKVDQDSYELFDDVLPVNTDHYILRNRSSAEIMNKYIIKQAHEQSINKFGERISHKIGDVFEEEIIQKLQNIIPNITQSLPEEDWSYLKVSANGTGERILHLYNEKTMNDIFRFHVRRHHLPNQGYFFNFHYHTYLDDHENHHDLGTIYWGKDMPQKWSM